jgi:hypothetical protein
MIYDVNRILYSELSEPMDADVCALTGIQDVNEDLLISGIYVSEECVGITLTATKCILMNFNSIAAIHSQNFE